MGLRDRLHLNYLISEFMWITNLSYIRCHYWLRIRAKCFRHFHAWYDIKRAVYHSHYLDNWYYTSLSLHPSLISLLWRLSFSISGSWISNRASRSLFNFLDYYWWLGVKSCTRGDFDSICQLQYPTSFLDWFHLQWLVFITKPMWNLHSRALGCLVWYSIAYWHRCLHGSGLGRSS